MDIRRAERLTAWLGCLCVIAFTTGVLAGRLLGREGLIDLMPGLVPMQFNTALGCGLAALAVLCAEVKRRHIARALALFVICFAALIGSQYLLSYDSGIDRLFVEPVAHTRTAFPGRMAPNTAICLMLFSAGLLYWTSRSRADFSFNAFIFCALSVMLVGVIVLCGYALKVEAAYSWWGLSDMASQTAAMLVLLGLGSLGHARVFSGETDGTRLQLWLPAYAGMVVVLLTLLLAQGMLVYQKNLANTAAAREGTRLGTRVEIELERLVLASLRRMQHRWNAGDERRQEAWKRDAGYYVQDNASYHSFALNRGGGVVAAVPDNTVDFWNAAETQPSKRDESITGVLRLDGQPAVVVFHLPLAEDRLTLSVAYKVEDAMARLVSDYRTPGYVYALIDENGHTIHSTQQDRPASAWGGRYDEPLEVAGQRWQIQTSADVAAFQENGLILMVIVFGFSMGALLSYALYQTGKSRAYQQRLEAIMNQMADGLVTADARGAVMSFNRACARMFGYTLEEMTGKDAQILANGFIPAAGGMGTIREMEGRRRDGRTFPMDLSVTETWLGREKIYTAILRDITERKTKEDELKRSNTELEQFAYVASHDLKAPLRGIDNLARWIAEDLGDAITPQAKEQLGLLHKRVERLETLLEDILRYSRAGRMVDKPECIDTAELLSQITVPLTMDGKFKIVVEGKLPVITAHRTPLEQVLSNLVVNAMKHHDKGEGVLALGAARKGAFYEFFIRDDGPGIPPQFHDKVFQMFQTLQPRDRREGSGLGMSIVKKLVEWQGGRVWIEPHDGRGTTIRFLWRDLA